MIKCKLYYVENGNKKWPEFYKLAESAYDLDLTPMVNFTNCYLEHNLKLTLPIRHFGINGKWELNLYDCNEK